MSKRPNPQLRGQSYEYQDGEDEPLQTEGISGAEDRPDIIHTPHIIEDDDDGELRFTTEGLCREALHLRDL